MSDDVLIIVESPTKARTIKKFLGKHCKVMACMGHIRDLPRKAAEIPPDMKGKSWVRLGIDVENDFAPLYVLSPQKSKTIAEMNKAIKGAKRLYLATDEDREGESISWHLVEVLKPKIPTKRMVFHEITAKAIQDALENPRDLNMRLVRSQEARRILDRLVGYTLSPLIWKKIAYGLSAGRVQSVALRALVDLEKERMLFIKASYWGVWAELGKEGVSFESKLVQLGGKKLAIGKDFDERTGKLRDGKKVLLLDESDAHSIQRQVSELPWTVSKVEEKSVSRKPAPPFITSTLQQEANRKLRLSARDTMRIAQSLYEKGFITYMRTDSVSLSQSAISSSRKCVQQLFGKKYLSGTPRVFRSKSKGAQEAHEAIRPSLKFLPPSETGLSGKDLALYELIWMRTVATQMANAEQLQVSASLSVSCKEGEAIFQASGMRIVFPGFLKAYVEGEDNPDKALSNRERLLPDLKKSDSVEHKSSKPTQHETKPTARYTEATLIQLMEKEGIGRPSTYASTVSTIVDRGYVQKQGSTLVPTFTGLVVTQLMSNYFGEFVDFGFTSRMEENLDKIAQGELDYIPYLRNFYLGEKGLENRVKQEGRRIKDEEARSLRFGHIKNLNIRVGKYGPYFEYSDPKSGEITKASVPPEIAPADLNMSSIEKIIEQVKAGPKSLAIDPETKKPIYLRTGSYGPYLQLGDVPDEGEKLKRVSVPKNMDPESIGEKEALSLIALPKKLGSHPETGKDVVASIGRFGPYVVHEKDFRSLKKDDDLLTIDFARAMELLSAPKLGRGRKKIVKELGEHPDSKERIDLYQGPYGIYIKYGKKNISIPEGKNPEALSLEDCVLIVNEKGGKKAPKGKRGTKKKSFRKKKKVQAKKSPVRKNTVIRRKARVNG